MISTRKKTLAFKRETQRPADAHPLRSRRRAEVFEVRRKLKMNFQDLLKQYRNESLSEAEKGSKFERLMRAYLLALPKYQGFLEKVWL